MQSRLEEEEEAKPALMSRIQKLTKLILVSTKISIPGYLGDTPAHQRIISAGKDDVIGKRTEAKTTHVQFRDSKLTRLLQSSLSGHGHVSLMCTVTPASSSTEETHNTLKFASRVKGIEMNASRNKIIDEKSLIKKYQKEISTLKVELDQLRRGWCLSRRVIEPKATATRRSSEDAIKIGGRGRC